MFRATNISNNEAFLQNFLHTNLMNKSWLLYNISISQSLAEHCTNEYFNCLIYMFFCKSEVHKIGISFFYKRHIFIYADPIFVIVIWFILYRAIYTHDAMGHMTNIDVHVYVLQELWFVQPDCRLVLDYEAIRLEIWYMPKCDHMLITFEFI